MARLRPVGVVAAAELIVHLALERFLDDQSRRQLHEIAPLALAATAAGNKSSRRSPERRVLPLVQPGRTFSQVPPPRVRYKYAKCILVREKTCVNMTAGIAHEVFARRPPQGPRPRSGPLSYLVPTLMPSYELETTVL